MNIAKIAIAALLLLATAACAKPTEKEFYSAKYTSAGGCNWTHVTCYAGEKRPENVIYEDNVCRFYFNFGELSVAHSHDEMVKNVILTRNENCTFQRAVL
jgi:hypothetical protein